MDVHIFNCVIKWCEHMSLLQQGGLGSHRPPKPLLSGVSLKAYLTSYFVTPFSVTLFTPLLVAFMHLTVLDITFSSQSDLCVSVQESCYDLFKWLDQALPTYSSAVNNQRRQYTFYVAALKLLWPFPPLPVA